MILIFYNSSLMRYDLHLTGNSYSITYQFLYHNLYLVMNQCMKVSWCQCVLWHAINQSRSLVIQSIQYHVLHNAALHNAALNNVILYYLRILFSRNSNLQNITIHVFQKYHVDALSYISAAARASQILWSINSSTTARISSGIPRTQVEKKMR